MHCSTGSDSTSKTKLMTARRRILATVQVVVVAVAMVGGGANSSDGKSQLGSVLWTASGKRTQNIMSLVGFGP